MNKQNCWEFMKCGREFGGNKVFESGVCPAFLESRLNGINGGKNGGRSCWPIPGTLCDGKVYNTFASKLSSCIKCEFYKLVGLDEEANYQSAKKILAKLRAKTS